MQASHLRAFQVILSLAALAGFIGSAAAESGSPCTVIEDGAARLACYDSQFGRTVAAPPARAMPAPAATTTAATTAAATTAAATTEVAATAAVAAPPQPVEKQVEQFGLDPAAAQRQAAKTAAVPPPDTIESINSTVNVVKRRGTGELVLTLANDQVWMQTQADSRVWIRPGDPVTIKKALLGSYMLVSGRYAFKVRRLD
jgi:hypothetical protein